MHDTAIRIVALRPWCCAAGAADRTVHELVPIEQDPHRDGGTETARTESGDRRATFRGARDETHGPDDSGRDTSARRCQEDHAAHDGKQRHGCGACDEMSRHNAPAEQQWDPKGDEDRQAIPIPEREAQPGCSGREELVEVASAQRAREEAAPEADECYSGDRQCQRIDKALAGSPATNERRDDEHADVQHRPVELIECGLRARGPRHGRERPRCQQCEGGRRNQPVPECRELDETKRRREDQRPPHHDCERRAAQQVVAAVVVRNPEGGSRRYQDDCQARVGGYQLERPSPWHDCLRYSACCAVVGIRGDAAASWDSRP